MCGIAGIVAEGSWREKVEAMSACLAHRGPDDSGLWSEPGVALGHRRLAILDLSPAGHQPMSHAGLTLVYNGEIYNYRELQRELPGPFSSTSDTEVLLHLYARDGEPCVERLAGMFAFAVWDSRRRVLFAARDRIGIKPLYYRELPGGGLAFASELKALTGLGELSLDRGALGDFFSYKYVPAPKTIWSGVAKLPPGHCLRYDGRTLRIWRYWTPALEITETDETRALSRLETLLAEIVPAHTLADVPVGVFLSGGIDSTLLVAHLRQARTFTVGFDVAGYSEAGAARRVAEHFGTEHHERTVGGVDVEQALEAIPRMFDEPFGDSAAWSTHVVAREARREVTVALSGEGGDEVFSGYRHHGKWLAFRSSPLARGLARRLPPFSRAALSLLRRGAVDLERYAALIAPFTPAQKRALLVPELVPDDHDDLWHFRRFWDPQLPPLRRMQWVELNTLLPDGLLTKVDRTSMAVSLEVRPPLLDHRLVEFALSLDPALLRREGTGKLLLRRNLAGRVPAEVLARPKRGFSMPVSRWLADRPELVREAMARLVVQGILRTAKPPQLHSTQLWCLLVLDRWLR